MQKFRCRVLVKLHKIVNPDKINISASVAFQGEESFLGDELIEGGSKGMMTNGKDYREVRQFQRPRHLIRFYFITRVYNSYVETVLADLAKDPVPDVIIMNSCLWDITRYATIGNIYVIDLLIMWYEVVWHEY